MGLITDQEFLSHQGLLGSGFAAFKQAQVFLESGLSIVVSSTDIEVEVDMLEPYAGNFSNLGPELTAPLLRRAHEALVRHVTDGTGQTFNDYLFIRNLKVTPDFAELSERLGFPVSPVNVD